MCRVRDGRATGPLTDGEPLKNEGLSGQWFAPCGVSRNAVAPPGSGEGNLQCRTQDLQRIVSLQLGRPSGEEVGDIDGWALATLEICCRRVVVFGQVGRVLRNAVAPPCSPYW